MKNAWLLLVAFYVINENTASGHCCYALDRAVDGRNMPLRSGKPVEGKAKSMEVGVILFVIVCTAHAHDFFFGFVYTAPSWFFFRWGWNMRNQTA
jgi:hypothetical protein